MRLGKLPWLVELPKVQYLRRVLDIRDCKDHWLVVFLFGETERIHKTEGFPSEYKQDYWDYKIEQLENFNQ